MEREELPDDEGAFRPPLPPDDRLWRHPSEMGRPGPTPVAPAPAASSPPRHPVSTLLLAGAAAALLLVGVVAATQLGPGTTEVASTSGGGLGAGPTTAVVASTVGSVAPVREPVRQALARLVATTAHGDRSSTAVVIAASGILLAAMDAVNDATAIRLELSDGRTAPAELLGTDPTSGLAVLRTSATGLAEAVPVSAASLQPGAALKLVAPQAGTLAPRVVTGKLAGMGQHVELSDGRSARHLLLIDVPATADSLGAGITDERGRLVAIVTARQGDDLYATPLGVGSSVATSLEVSGRVRVPWLGIEGSNAEPTWSRANGVTGGAVVLKKSTSSPASTSPLDDGDVIVAIDGEPTPSMAAVAIAVRSRQVGDTITITFRHDDHPDATTVQLAEAPGT